MNDDMEKHLAMLAVAGIVGLAAGPAKATSITIVNANFEATPVPDWYWVPDWDEGGGLTLLPTLRPTGGQVLAEFCTSTQAVGFLRTWATIGRRLTSSRLAFREIKGGGRVVHSKSNCVKRTARYCGTAEQLLLPVPSATTLGALMRARSAARASWQAVSSRFILNA